LPEAVPFSVLYADVPTHALLHSAYANLAVCPRSRSVRECIEFGQLARHVAVLPAVLGQDPTNAASVAHGVIRRNVYHFSPFKGDWRIDGKLT
jgi:hypothetical protein